MTVSLKHYAGALLVLILILNLTEAKSQHNFNILPNDVSFQTSFAERIQLAVAPARFARELTRHSKSLLAAIRYKATVSNAQHLSVESGKSTTNDADEINAQSGFQLANKEPVLWTLFVNYFVVIVAVFLILYRTRTNREKDGLHRWRSYRERRKLAAHYPAGVHETHAFGHKHRAKKKEAEIL